MFCVAYTPCCLQVYRLYNLLRAEPLAYVLCCTFFVRHRDKHIIQTAPSLYDSLARVKVLPVAAAFSRSTVRLGMGAIDCLRVLRFRIIIPNVVRIAY